jgi:hypothetical protein
MQMRDAARWYGEMDFISHFWNLLQIDTAEVALMIHEPIKPSRIRRAKIIARAAQQKVISGFDSALAPGYAEIPVELPVVISRAQKEEQSNREESCAPDFIVGAILFSLLASNQSEIISEMIPHSENWETP